jgi:hypothetical protein
MTLAPPAVSVPHVFSFTADPHEYRIDDVVVPSVTQVLEEERFIDFSRVPADTLAEAQARGTYVHTVLHFYLEGDFDLDDCDPRFRGYVDSALWYLDRAKMKPLRNAEGVSVAVEYRFWDPERRFAGTVDYLAWDPDGILAIPDWKTGEPSDVAAPLQTAAYEYGVRKFLLPTVLPRYTREIRRRAVKLFKDGRPGRPEPYTDSRDLGMFFTALSCVHFRRNHLRYA